MDLIREKHFCSSNILEKYIKMNGKLIFRSANLQKGNQIIHLNKMCNLLFLMKQNLFGLVYFSCALKEMVFGNKHQSRKYYM